MVNQKVSPGQVYKGQVIRFARTGVRPTWVGTDEKVPAETGYRVTAIESFSRKSRKRQERYYRITVGDHGSFDVHSNQRILVDVRAPY